VTAHDRRSRGQPSRWLLTGYAAAQVMSVVPLLVLLVLSVVGGVLVVVWVGLALLALAVPATRWFADRHRSMAARVLGVPVPRPYRPVPRGGPLARLRAVLVDPMTWRDLGWILAAATGGLALSLLVLVLVLAVVTGFVWWFATPPLLVARARMDLAFLAYSRTERLEQRVQQLTETRADLVDHSAAELRRLERDLHDGAQARLVALSMSLGMADASFDEDPGKARKLLQDARSTTAAAIGELRSVVRGIHPRSSPTGG
jgi:signal transduction histidine kinase